MLEVQSNWPAHGVEPEKNLAVAKNMALLRRSSLFVGIAWLMLAACDETRPSQEDAGISAGPEPARRATSMSDIAGFWLIDRFEDFVPSWRNGAGWRRAYVFVDGDRLTYNMGCNQSGNPAALGGDGVLRDTGDGSRLQTLQGCSGDKEARDGRLFSFFGSLPAVYKLGADRLLLKSGAGELVLVTPERWRQDHEPTFADVQGRWVPKMVSRYDGPGYEGFGTGDGAGVISIEPGRVVWSGCPQIPISIRWAADARLVTENAVDPTDCRAVVWDSRNGAGLIMAMLISNPAVIRTGEDRIVLCDGTGEKGWQLELVSEQSILNPPPPPDGYDGKPPAPPPPPPPPPPSS